MKSLGFGGGDALWGGEFYPKWDSNEVRDGALCCRALCARCGCDFPHKVYVLIRSITELRELEFHFLSASVINKGL